MRGKPGRFVIDTHVHGQRHAVNFEANTGEANYGSLAGEMRTAVPADEADETDEAIVYKNTDRLTYDMDAYGVDRCLLLPGFGMSNRLNREMVEDHPDRFKAMAAPVKTMKNAIRGEEEYSYDAACEELDELLSQDAFVGIGEGLPCDPTVTEHVPWDRRRDQIRKVFDVAAKHDVPVSWHAGRATGYSGSGSTEGGSFPQYYPDWKDLSLVSELAAEYPDVSIMLNHGGMQGGWREDTVDTVCKVAARHDNVHFEIGLYWADLLKKPMDDPSIDLSQLLWGTDWGASIVAHSQPTKDPPIYWDQISERGLPAHQPDYWGTSLRQIEKYTWDEELPQDELNQILGGNACDLFGFEPPESRMFPEYL
ncbi:amidohydrolase family protein [Halobellus salinisoli]|uniref:amidohydrolase family protein n=1 Tax=Halobellus salinisoli TaxID=3108500 RepID=UPI00300BF2CF